MKSHPKKFILRFSFIVNFFLLICSISFADNHNIYETLEQIQKDIKTLEKAVYNQDVTSTTSTTIQGDNDVLTKHLLKLSDLEQ